MALTIRQKQAVFVKALTELFVYANLRRIDFCVLELYRSPRRQLELFRQGRTKTLSSKHLLGLAVDIAILKDGRVVLEHIPEYDLLGEFWSWLGGTWGGHWESLEDIYHFEYSDRLIERYRHYVTFLED